MRFCIRNTLIESHLEKCETVSHFSRVQRFEESQSKKISALSWVGVARGLRKETADGRKANWKLQRKPTP
jgi:hypothetical protein